MNRVVTSGGSIKNVCSKNKWKRKLDFKHNLEHVEEEGTTVEAEVIKDRRKRKLYLEQKRLDVRFKRQVWARRDSNFDAEAILGDVKKIKSELRL